jgi:hypothetical protein
VKVPVVYKCVAHSATKGTLKTLNHFVASRILFVGMLLISPTIFAQTAGPLGAINTQGVPPPRASMTGVPVDLSGIWTIGGGASLSPKGGTMDAGTPADGIPYQAWALQKFKEQRTAAGPNSNFDNPTDPVINLCDPQPAPRIYTWPSKFKFVQTPDAVYILYEYGPFWRPVFLNRKHPDPADQDNTWWGDAIGHYEGNDTFVIDTVGFNDRTWLDYVGHVHSDKLHLIERFRRVDTDHMEISITVDDPGAYTATWTFGPRIVKRTNTRLPYGLYPWICSQEENQHFNKDVVDPTLTPPKK